METEEKKSSLKPLSHGRRSAKFFDITGHSLVHPMSYHMQGFQKQIILTAIFRNTLINLPPGLGMPYLASVIIFNYQRWFLNGKIVVLSLTKSCIVEQINALGSYTTICKELYSDLYGNTLVTDNEAAWNKPIILASPAKFLESIQSKMCTVNDLVLLIIYETSKVTKCQEYKDIMTLLTGLEFRINVFIEGGGFNAKSLKQIIETFSISQVEFRSMSSEDIKECTFRSEIESVSLEISPHMTSIKDAFYAVYEKYGKLLKDAKVITGNVANFTKLQVQKAKEKLIKTPPQNMNKDTLQNLLDGMTMCSFLCVGIEILHNWGVRSFYNYLFDENKDSELKRLIVKDDHLKNQMKLLNEYLKSNGKKMESLMSRIVHPKLIYLKNLILRSFSEAEGIIDDFRIVIFCSMDEIIDDIDGLLSNLPNFIRHQCVRTKSKLLSNTNDYKEVVQNFNSGVINVVALNNLVEEINDLKTNLVVALEPNKTLIKFSDPRFTRAPDKCFFVLTKGVEYQKFETLLNEKRNEQKPIELPVVDHILRDSPTMFPEGFNPDFESTSVGQLVRNTDQLAGQKSIVNYLNCEKDGKSRKNISVFDDSDFVDSSIFIPKPAQRKLSSRENSPPFPLFGASAANTPSTDGKKDKDTDQFYDQFYTSPVPVPYTEQLGYSNASKEDDSCDDLILDFAVPLRDKTTSKSAKAKEPVKSQSSDKENFDLEIYEVDKISKCGNDMNHNEFKAPQSDSKSSLLSKLQSLRDRAANLPFDLDASLSAESSVPNSEHTSPKSKASVVFDDDDIFNDLNFPEIEIDKLKEIPAPESSKNDSRSSNYFCPSVDVVNERGKNAPLVKKSTFEEVTMFDSSKDDSRLSKNSRKSIDVVHDTVQNSTLVKKDTLREVTMFGSPKDDSRWNGNSRTSIDFVYDTGQNPTSKKSTFKETSFFDCSKEDSRLSKGSRSSIDMVYDTGQNPATSRKNLFREDTFFGSSRDDSQSRKSFRTSISVLNDTEQVPTTSRKNLFREDTLFGSSKNDSSLSKNSRTSISIVNDTEQVSTTSRKNLFREDTLFGSSKNDSSPSKNSRTNISIVNDTEQVSTTSRKNLFREDTLFGSSKNDSSLTKNSRTSIDSANDTKRVQTTMKKFIFKEKTSFGRIADDSRLSKNSRTSIGSVNDTEQYPATPKNASKENTLFGTCNDTRFNQNPRASTVLTNDTRPSPVSTKSPIFSAKKFNETLPKNNHLLLKNKSPSIHFGSSFELDDDFFPSDFCPNPPKTTAEEKKVESSPKNNPDESNQSDDSCGDEKPPDVANIDDWDPDCELFQDEDSFDNAVVDIVTPQKDPISVKTSTPIVNSKTTPSVTEALPVVDLITPQSKPKNKTDNLWRQNQISSSVDSLASTELPKPNRSLKNPSTDTCDINISDNCRKKAISNSFFSNFSLSLKQRSRQNQNSQNTATASSAKYSAVDDDTDDFPWMKTKINPPEKAKLKTNPNENTLYPWMRKSPVKPPSSSAGASSWLRRSPVESVPSSSSDSPTAPIASTSAFAANRACGATTVSPSIAHSTPDFKKPGPFVIRSSASRSAHSSSGSDQKSISGESPSEPVVNKVKKKKKTNLKRNLAKQFLDNEAEVTSDDSDDTNVEGESDQSYENNSFIDDDYSDKNTNYSHYLKSMKSPRTEVGRFRIPVLSERKLKMNVFSQMDYFDQTYQQDSFCVDDVDALDQDSEYIPSVLTQMENRLQFEKKSSKRLPAVSSDESSPENATDKSTVRPKKKHRKRIVLFSSSDDDDDNVK